jgi:hypothetical protein
MKFFLPLAALLATTSFSSLVFAHEAPCPYCDMTITQDTPEQDNETVLKFGRKRIEYKCVYCALAEAKTEYAEGDLSILAPSEKKGQPVVLKRTGGIWAATPATAAFVVNTPLKHKACAAQARAFHTEAAAKEYATKNGFDAPLTLTQLLERAK